MTNLHTNYDCIGESGVPDGPRFALKLLLGRPQRLHALEALAVVALLFSVVSPMKAGFKAGLYFIVSNQPHPGFCIDLPSDKISNTEAPIQLINPTGGFTQKWDFIADPERPGSYLIKWHYSDKYLQPYGQSPDFAAIEFNKRDDNAFQSWVVEDAGNGQYYIRNDGSGKVITGFRAPTDPNPNPFINFPGVYQVDRGDGNPTQIWILQGTSP